MIEKESITSNYTKVSNKIVDDKRLSNNDKMLLILLNRMHKNSNIKQSELAQLLGMSLKTLKNSISNLKKYDYLELKEIQFHKYKYILKNLQDKKKEEKQESDQKEDEEIKEILDIYNSYDVFKVVNKLTKEQTRVLKELINKNSLDTTIKELKLFLDNNNFTNTNQLKYFINNYYMILSLRERKEKEEEKERRKKGQNFKQRNYTKEELKKIEDEFFDRNDTSEQEQEQEQERAKARKEIFNIYKRANTSFGIDVKRFNNILNTITKENNTNCSIKMFNDTSNMSIYITDVNDNNDYKRIINDLNEYINKLEHSKQAYN